MAAWPCRKLVRFRQIELGLYAARIWAGDLKGEGGGVWG